MCVRPVAWHFRIDSNWVGTCHRDFAQSGGQITHRHLTLLLFLRNLNRLRFLMMFLRNLHQRQLLRNHGYRQYNSCSSDLKLDGQNTGLWNCRTCLVPVQPRLTPNKLCTWNSCRLPTTLTVSRLELATPTNSGVCSRQCMRSVVVHYIFFLLFACLCVIMF